jgi:hypothetical protein
MGPWYWGCSCTISLANSSSSACRPDRSDTRTCLTATAGLPWSGLTEQSLATQQGFSWVYRRRRGQSPPWQLSAPYLPHFMQGILSLTDLSGSLAGHCSPRERTPGGVLTESHYEAAPLRIEIAQSCLSELARHPIPQPDVRPVDGQHRSFFWRTRRHSTLGTAAPSPAPGRRTPTGC